MRIRGARARATPRMIRLCWCRPCAGLESPGVLAMISLMSLAPRFKSSSADRAVMLIGTSRSRSARRVAGHDDFTQWPGRSKDLSPPQPRPLRLGGSCRNPHAYDGGINDSWIIARTYGHVSIPFLISQGPRGLAMALWGDLLIQRRNALHAINATAT